MRTWNIITTFSCGITVSYATIDNGKEQVRNVLDTLALKNYEKTIPVFSFLKIVTPCAMAR